MTAAREEQEEREPLLGLGLEVLGTVSPGRGTRELRGARRMPGGDTG